MSIATGVSNLVVTPKLYGELTIVLKGERRRRTERNDACLVEVRQVVLKFELGLPEVKQIVRTIGVLAPSHAVDTSASCAGRSVASVEREKSTASGEIDPSESDSRRLCRHEPIGGRWHVGAPARSCVG